MVRRLAAVISVQIARHQASSTPTTAVSPLPWLQQDARLGGDIALHVAVPLEVVGRDVEDDRDVRLRGSRSGRAGRTTAPARRRRRRACPRGRARRTPMLPPMRTSRPAWLQNVADQGGGGRLAVGAGDGDHLRPLVRRGGGDGAGEELDVADDLDAGGLGLLAPSSAARDGSAARRARAPAPQSFGQSALRRSSSGKPSAAAASRAPRRSRPTTATSAPPARRARAAARPVRAEAEHGDLLCLEAADRDHGVRLPSPTAASGWPGPTGPA